MNTKNKKSIEMDVTTCARCEGDHKKVLFRKFTNEHRYYTHWALCPTNGEPILMVVVDDPK